MRKMILCLVLAAMVSLTAGCGLIGYEFSEGRDNPPVITAPPDTPEPQGTPEPAQEPTPTPSPSPSPSPTPEPIDLPTVIGQHLGRVPALILTEGMTAGTAAPDEVFAVALEENISTGYLWRWEEPDPALSNVLDTHWEPESDAVGVPGVHLWAFRTDTPGEHTLDFTLIAPDGGVGDVRSVTVTVES